ncbi:MAG: hypothetical protein WB611_22285, partial [Stellaceae bacterium]
FGSDQLAGGLTNITTGTINGSAAVENLGLREMEISRIKAVLNLAAAHDQLSHIDLEGWVPCQQLPCISRIAA